MFVICLTVNYLLFMNTSFFKLFFSDMQLPIAVAFSYDFSYEDIADFTWFWSAIELNFRTSFSHLIGCSSISANEFDKCVLKFDFRVK